jgi:pimeloyl-ACP methyl ester carboxylesterase
MTVQGTVGRQLDEATAELLDRAEAAVGTGPDAFAAVLEATLAARTVSAELTTTLLTRLWFTPWRLDPGDRVRAREAAWLEGSTPLTVDAGRHRLAGFESGSGPTVLLVHGWGDCASRMGGFVEPLRTRGLRVLAVDLPAHGANEGDRTDLYECAAAITEVLAAQDVRGVVAHSMGGQTVVQALRQAPRVSAAALIAPAVRLESSLRTFGAALALDAEVLGLLREQINRSYGSQVWSETDADAAARHLRVPALIVHSRDDEQVSDADIGLLAAAWPGAELATFDGLGHSRILRDAGVVTRVAGFLGHRLLGEQAAS